MVIKIDRITAIYIFLLQKFTGQSPVFFILFIASKNDFYLSDLIAFLRSGALYMYEPATSAVAP